MTDKSYLFFDIECANCFGGVGKMCSFGYVLADSGFRILDEQDVVMNPEAEFDWYLFSPKNKCPLAYSKDYFRRQRTFEAYHREIKRLMEAPGRSVIGFSSANDVGFLTSACERYQLPAIQFAAYDAAAIIDSANGAHKSLADWCGHYGVDTAGLRAHRSCDDAKMTMLLLKAFCGQSGASLESVLERHKDSRLSVESYMERRAQKRHDDELMKKITELYGKKCRARLSNALDGGQYSFGFKLRSDNMEEACALAALVYKHGGMLRKRLSHSGTIILEDGQINSERTERMKAQGLSVISISGLRELVRME